MKSKVETKSSKKFKVVYSILGLLLCFLFLLIMIFSIRIESYEITTDIVRELDYPGCGFGVHNWVRVPDGWEYIYCDTKVSHCDYPLENDTKVCYMKVSDRRADYIKFCNYGGTRCVVGKNITRWRLIIK